MDMCFNPKSKNEVSSSESRLKNVNSKDKIQKEATDFRQNNNAHLNHVSFIPVYTKKTLCHYFSDKGDENRSMSVEHQDQNKFNILSNSPPSRQKNSIDQKEKILPRSVRTHMRRRSVGFEDVTSCYILNEKSINETMTKNSNISTKPDIGGKILHSDNETNLAYERINQKEGSFVPMYNPNTKVVKNANDQKQETCQPYQQYKDKSSKRKSSLNRMDFLDFPATNTAGPLVQFSYQSKNSSSDEEGDTHLKQNQTYLNSCKRKQYNSAISGSCASKHYQKRWNDASYQKASPPNKVRPLPKTLLNPSHLKLRQYKRMHPLSVQLQKFSHSAGELESLTDEINGSNKVCLSAQEFDTRISSTAAGAYLKNVSSNFKQQSFPLPPEIRSSSPTGNSKQDTSQNTISNDKSDLQLQNSSSAAKINSSANAQDIMFSPISDDKQSKINISHERGNISSSALVDVEPILSRLNLNDSFELKHIDSKSEDDVEIADSTLKMQTSDFSEEKTFENSPMVSDDNCDSDGEKRPNSILRKKNFEEKRELHSILKPPPDDKSSKTLPSILKHRESSEEKDVWQQSDLHSILKKSTSEDESCNSGPDIRPILKVSTDDDSPGCSSKPRPILKKRTSFSEECSYASYPNGELKPILKKKAPLSTDDQPRPILKSRRKSEDTRSTLSEFVSSRPRAYSADMGIKSNHENRTDGLEQKTEDFCKRENQQP